MILDTVVFQIRDSNRAMLLAACKEHHCEVIDLGITPDIEAEVNQLLDKALASNADVLITSGGVSMGDKDFVKPLLEERGKVYFTKVNVLRLRTQLRQIIDFNHALSSGRILHMEYYMKNHAYYFPSSV